MTATECVPLIDTQALDRWYASECHEAARLIGGVRQRLAHLGIGRMIGRDGESVDAVLEQIEELVRQEGWR